MSIPTCDTDLSVHMSIQLAGTIHMSCLGMGHSGKVELGQYLQLRPDIFLIYGFGGLQARMACYINNGTFG